MAVPDKAKRGIQRCMMCRWLFVSPDVLRVRRCADCKSGENAYTPKTGNVVTAVAGCLPVKDTS